MPTNLTLFTKTRLLRSEVLGQWREGIKATPVPNEAHLLGQLKNWVDSLAGNAHLGELVLEQRFNAAIFEQALGYVLYPQPTGTPATCWAKVPTAATGIPGEPDLALGNFTAGQHDFSAVVELKAPGANLDAPQARFPPITPVQQAFEYASAIPGVRWVLVSDMRIIRLYEVSDQYSYQEFDLRLAATGGQDFRDFYFLLNPGALVDGGADSSTSRLVAKSLDVQSEIRAGFYDVYYQIRQDLYQAIAAAPEIRAMPTPPDKTTLLRATQRLLDRMTFIYYCEDHPEKLLPPRLSAETIDAARKLPRIRSNRIYGILKDLFREIDTGSVPGAGGEVITGYNGELFKDDPILDHISLPDGLADKVYKARIGPRQERRITGVWGLNAFDFWAELNEHLLGRIFEESLSDLAAMAGAATPAEKMAERKRHGIFFTQQLLCDFMAEAAIGDLLRDRVPAPTSTEPATVIESLRQTVTAAQNIKVIDLACGSGAFLTASYSALLRAWTQASVSIDELEQKTPDLGLFGEDPTKLLRSSLYGSDCMPQAIEISKLALWLRSARKGEKVANLGHNLITADSLDLTQLAGGLGLDTDSLDSFDLVIGNPPWGAEVDAGVARALAERLGLEPNHPWDSWELFVALGIALLRDGGRISLVLPDTLFSPAKAAIRAHINQQLQLERVHNLGPDWFGPRIRMGTVVLQGRRPRPAAPTNFMAMLLAGSTRRKALTGELRLSQAESKLALPIPQVRTDLSPSSEIDVYRSTLDDVLINAMGARSIPLGDLCDRGRGEEINKAGTYWQCPSCLEKTVPGRKNRGTYEDKTCPNPNCGILLTHQNVVVGSILTPLVGPSAKPWLDGDLVVGRYARPVPTLFLDVGILGWSYKDAAVYAPPKILIRQAGVGLSATLDITDARVPQSLYTYRLKPAEKAMGYREEYVLGVLLSRCMHYLVCKYFGEVDAARAHAKVTHERLSRLPVPKIDFTDTAQRALHQQIVDDVTVLLGGSESLGGAADLRIEQSVRILYAVKPLGMAFINGELSKLPESQAISELYPAGTARPPVLATPSPAELVEDFVPTATPLVELAADEEPENDGVIAEGDEAAEAVGAISEPAMAPEGRAEADPERAPAT